MTRLPLVSLSFAAMALFAAVPAVQADWVTDVKKFTGTITDVGVVRGPGQTGGVEYRIHGVFTSPLALALDNSTFTIEEFFVEPNGAGELMRASQGPADKGPEGDPLLAPITLTSSQGDPDDATFETPGRFRPQIKVKVVRQTEFYAEQSTVTTNFITGLGTIIALMMALGALLGALNTMYNAVASRGREIATLRALGFGAAPVVCSVLIESLALALAGGIVGGLGAYLAFDGYGAATMNFQTWSQIAFAFAVTPKLLFNAIVLAAVIGLLGGILPAIRAARLPIAAALRDT